MPKITTKSSVPHSWGIDAWPADVYPGTVGRARYLVRVHRESLMLEGALVRVGRDLVVIGARYSRWLEKKAALVAEYEIAPNRDRSAA